MANNFMKYQLENAEREKESFKISSEQYKLQLKANQDHMQQELNKRKDSEYKYEQKLQQLIE